VKLVLIWNLTEILTTCSFAFSVIRGKLSSHNWTELESCFCPPQLGADQIIGDYWVYFVMAGLVTLHQVASSLKYLDSPYSSRISRGTAPSSSIDTNSRARLRLEWRPCPSSAGNLNFTNRRTEMAAYKRFVEWTYPSFEKDRVVDTSLLFVSLSLNRRPFL
jgi:hypothetical protein